MTKWVPMAVRRQRWPVVSVLIRITRRTLGESLYLITGPVTASVGLLAALGGLCLAMVGLVLPGRSRVIAGALAPVRWCADVEWWRITRTRALRAGPPGSGQRVRHRGPYAVSDPGLWLDTAHAMVVFPVALVTSLVTLLWWWFAIALVTVRLRGGYVPGSLRPQTLNVGNAQSHVDISLGLTTPDSRTAFAAVVGLLLLVTLPLATQACLAVQGGLGRALLSDASALHRRIRGLEQERDVARAQTVAAVSAEAAALRRLERDIHDGPQQRLVRLVMELGRAEHHFDSRPETVREALADAILQAREALEELRALSRGIAPPVLADRGLREAVGALAATATIPVELDARPLDRRLDAAVETAAYFVIAEALTNVAKHSHARRCQIGVRHGGGALRVWVTDDGAGGAALAKGHGLRGLDDRVRTLGGLLDVTSPGGGPTTITAELPCC